MLSEIVEIEHLSLNLKHKQMIPWKWKTQNNILHSLVCFVKEVGVNVNGTQGANCPILKRNFKTQFKKKKILKFCRHCNHTIFVIKKQSFIYMISLLFFFHDFIFFFSKNFNLYNSFFFIFYGGSNRKKE